MKILVTGANGFLGGHLVRALSEMPDIDVLTYCRSDHLNTLYSHLAAADFTFHLAGVNRPKNKDEFITSNICLTYRIAQFLLKNKIKTPIYFSSSIHSSYDTEYGLSKKNCEATLSELMSLNGNRCFIDRLPRIFGPKARPNYNSVVATLCHSIVCDLDVEITDPNLEVEISFINDWINEMIGLLKDDNHQIRHLTYLISLGDLFEILYHFKHGSIYFPKYISNDLLQKIKLTYDFYHKSLHNKLV